MNNDTKLTLYLQYRNELVQSKVHNDFLLTITIISISILLIVSYLTIPSLINTSKLTWILLFFPILFSVLSEYFGSIDITTILSVADRIIFGEENLYPTLFTYITKACNFLSIFFLILNIILFIIYM